MLFEKSLSFNPTDTDFVKEVLNDYKIACESRQVSLAARKEVLTGKAKFGITGDGKEIAQLAMARAFRNGDYRAGYYRDQTFMFAAGLSTLEQFFAQIYGDVENDPFSGGRQMNSHYSTELLDGKGNWLPQNDRKNVSSDNSCTAGQVARALGLALATQKYKNIDALKKAPYNQFSREGSEITFCTIGDGSTSEGPFWETMNAAGVLGAPLLMSVWDDGYAISVPTSMQTVKGSISKALSGMLLDENGEGIMLYVVKGWNYAELCHT